MRQGKENYVPGITTKAPVGTSDIQKMVDAAAKVDPWLGLAAQVVSTAKVVVEFALRVNSDVLPLVVNILGGFSLHSSNPTGAHGYYRPVCADRQSCSSNEFKSQGQA